jgi:cobalt-zinc-cadmium resistance protein CzcA
MLNAASSTWSLAPSRGRRARLGSSRRGRLAFRRLPIDAFPDTTPVQVQVNTVAPALAPLEIERQITIPVEQAISGLPGLHEVRSSPVRALAGHPHFEDGTDIYLARQLVGRAPAARRTSRRGSSSPSWARSPPAWARSSTTS